MTDELDSALNGEFCVNIPYLQDQVAYFTSGYCKERLIQ